MGTWVGQISSNPEGKAVWIPLHTFPFRFYMTVRGASHQNDSCAVRPRKKSAREMLFLIMSRLKIAVLKNGLCVPVSKCQLQYGAMDKKERRMLGAGLPKEENNLK